MKRIISSLLIASCVWGVANISRISPLSLPALAQTQASEDLSYNFYGKQIPLSLREDLVAVSFKDVRLRGKPLHLQLQQDLQSGVGSTRSTSGGTNSEIEVKPLGDRLALVSVPVGIRGGIPSLTERIKKQTYVQETLPVLTRGAASEEEKPDTIVLPNEIVVSFESNLSQTRQETLLRQNNLEIIRPLRFSQNRYLVRSTTASGTAVLGVANQLHGTTGIQSATPNFIQVLSYQEPQLNATMTRLGNVGDADEQLRNRLTRLTPIKDLPFLSKLLPLQWHLDSTPIRGKLLPRTDLQVTSSWRGSKAGDSVVVAVIDSLIQWNHPDLVANLYKYGEFPDQLPNETSGWDFSSEGEGDFDTRLSEDELEALQPHLQNTFKLGCAELVSEYYSAEEAAELSQEEQCQVAEKIRNKIRNGIAAEFHGTWVAGVVAANPENENGVIGVAPKAKILPVRVFGLFGEIDAVSLIEAIGYAAARNVDVINMSLGGFMPHQELVEQVFDVLDANPNLVIVAAAGNDDMDGVSVPAVIPGVVAVGATNLDGNRAFYSNYGGGLTVVAPGGDLSVSPGGGILTTGGTFLDGFWQGMDAPNYAWGVNLDSLGKYVQVQGTSFASPAVAGVVALMKGEKVNLSREKVVKILQDTASYEALNLTKSDQATYRLRKEVGFTGYQDRLPGIFNLSAPISAEQYFFGSGLVNAEAAIKEAKR